MIRRFHEAPKEIFKQVQDRTSGDYCLANLYQEDLEYREQFKQAVKEGREVILDNAVFELEKPFNPEEFKKLILDLKPTWYIIPDELENTQKTLENAQNWVEDLKKDPLPGKTIGVVQGKTYEEIEHCYKTLDQEIGVNMIAISFDYSYYRHALPHSNHLISWSLGRVQLIGELFAKGVINKDKKHHLLGCALPVEFKFYSDHDWIYSVDTSNPVVAGLKGQVYEKNWGLYRKDSQKLFTLINERVRPRQWSDIKHNIKEFRDICNGSINFNL